MIDISKGCYTRLDRLTEDEYHEVCKALIEAGADPREYGESSINTHFWQYVGVSTKATISLVVHWDEPLSFGKQAVEYSKEEILSSMPPPGSAPVKQAGAIVDQGQTWNVGDKFVCPQIPEDPCDTGAGWSMEMDSLVGDTLEVENIHSKGYLEAQGWYWQTDWVYKVHDGAMPVHDFMEEELFEDPELSIEEEKRDVDIMESIRRACAD